MAVVVRFYPTVELAPGADLPGAQPSGWSWTDITTYSHKPSQISITRGRRDRYAQTGPSACSLKLLNPAGIWVPDNPLSPYYGLIDQNTPLRVSVRPNDNALSDAFNRTASSSWGSADSGGAWTNTGGSASDFSVAAATGGRHLHTSAAVRHASRLGLSIVRSDQVVKVRVNATSTGAAQTAGLVLRYQSANDFIRGELQFGTTGVITARVVERISGADFNTWSAVTTLTHSTSTWYWLRIQSGLTSIRLRAWADGTTEPTDWLIDGGDLAYLVSTTAGTLGCHSIRETSNTNSNATIDFDSYSMIDGPRIQFTGYVDQWPTSWADESESVSFAQITASGQLRRVNQGRALKSALFRANTSEVYAGTPPVVAYWPMEDDSDATQFASGLTGGPPMSFTGFRPGSNSGFAGSASLPTGDADASFRSTIPAYAAATEWAVRFALQVPAPASNTPVIAWSTPTGTVRLWSLYINTDGTFTLKGNNAAGTDLLAAGSGSLSVGSIFDQPLYVTIDAAQNGGNVDWSCLIFTVENGGGSGNVGSVAGTIGNIAGFSHDALGFTAGGQTIGHLAVATDINVLTDGVSLISGYAGELASTRYTRLGAEENIPVFFGQLNSVGIDTGTTVQAMGNQRATTMLAQLRECEATEEGVLFDGKQGQVILLPRTMRQSHTVDLTLDHDAGQVGAGFEGIRDDFLLRTEVTVNRSGGSRGAVATDLTIARRVGVYTDSVTINSSTDNDLRPRAEWRLNMGKVREIRYPQVVLDLTRNRSLIGDWLDADIGSRVSITNVPAGLPPDDLDLLLEGYTEVFDSVTWRATLNLSPARPWNVFTIAGGGNRGRLASAGSTLDTGIDSSTTSLSVASTGGSLWKTGATSFDIGVGGERMTVTAVASAVTDAFGRSVSNGWGSADTGQVWTTSGGSAADYSVNGTRGVLNLASVNVTRQASLAVSLADFDVLVTHILATALPTGANVELGLRGRVSGSDFVAVRLFVETGNTISINLQQFLGGVDTLTGFPTVSGATATTALSLRCQAQGSTLRARAWLEGQPEPSTWDLSLTVTHLVAGSLNWRGTRSAGNTNVAPYLVELDGLTASNPQTLTVTRSVNGIVKSHLAAAAVGLWKAGVVAV